jgi:hypothetical protein
MGAASDAAKGAILKYKIPHKVLRQVDQAWFSLYMHI